MPRNSDQNPGQGTQGRFDQDDDHGVQTRSQNDFGGRQGGGQSNTGQRNNDYRSNGQGGSYDASRGGPNSSRFDDDDDQDFQNNDRRGQGQYAGGSTGNRDQSNQGHDEADFGAWHAYGHSRGYHGYQRRDGQSGGGTYGNADQGRYSDRDNHALAGNQGRPGNQTASRPGNTDQGQQNRSPNTQGNPQNRGQDDQNRR